MYRTLGGYDFRTNPPEQANQPVTCCADQGATGAADVRLVDESAGALEYFVLAYDAETIPRPVPRAAVSPGYGLTGSKDTQHSPGRGDSAGSTPAAPRRSTTPWSSARLAWHISSRCSAASLSKGQFLSRMAPFSR
jgi:hypothetical protein